MTKYRLVIFKDALVLGKKGRKGIGIIPLIEIIVDKVRQQICNQCRIGICLRHCVKKY